MAAIVKRAFIFTPAFLQENGAIQSSCGNFVSNPERSEGSLPLGILWKMNRSRLRSQIQDGGAQKIVVLQETLVSEFVRGSFGYDDFAQSAFFTR
jgi:hypothetical protein